MATSTIASHLDTDLIRRLAVLKIWTDTNGMHAESTHWKPGHAGSMFVPEQWLRKRDESEFDIEDIGALAVPPPTVKQLSEEVRRRYAFLSELDNEETIIAHSDERDRSLVIKMMRTLPTSHLEGVDLY